MKARGREKPAAQYKHKRNAPAIENMEKFTSLDTPISASSIANAPFCHEAGSRTPVEQQTHKHPRRPGLVIAMRCLLY